MIIRVPPILISTLVAIALFASGTRSAPPCSIVPFPVARDSQTTVFIARATGDTIYAGAGTVRYRVGGGHWSTNRNDRRIFGQRVVISRFAGAGTDSLRSVFARRGDSSVVVTPWDYDAGCEPAVWGRSFAWTPRDSVGVFTVLLRNRRHWAGDSPTFDAFAADIEPYPHSIFYQHGYHDTGAEERGESLTIEEFFEFYLSLPPFDSYPDSLGYRKAICAWAAAHPTQAKRFPASRVTKWERC